MSPDSRLTLFPQTTKASFIRRLNRFAIECAIDGTIMPVHLPNPGRLWELLFPGRTIYLEENRDVSRKTRYTAVAVEREGTPIVLHTHRTNTVVRWLLERGVVPGFENAEVVKTEASMGRSRFDFLLTNDDRPLLLEVKSCTLFGKTIAMFPDAVTARGQKHLRELADLSRQGTPSAVIFLVQWPRARYFLPDYHTDFDFARTFIESRNDVIMKAIAVEWSHDLSLGSHIRELEIPWDMIVREARDSGSYIIILNIRDDIDISVGKLGTIHFPKGFYLYVGSARRHLTQRMERHLRKRKNFFWHIDYLRNHTDQCMALPIRSSEPLEHELAKALSTISHWHIPGFGSSDCFCETHLFGMHNNPLDNPRFIDILLNFRINRLEKELP
jgi:sugar fermentation stimulation protein A